MSELTKLRHKRGILKGQLTLFEKFLSSIDEREFDDKLCINLHARLSKIEGLFDEFNNLQAEIAILETNVEEHLNETEFFHDKYFDLTSQAKSFLQLESNKDNASTRWSLHRQSGGVKLPKITLPSFDGTFTKWCEFYDTFKALVHSNGCISDAQKLCYLKASLTGEAANILTSYETTNDNYKIAFDILVERYNNRRRIVYNHVRSILELESIAKESHVHLRNLIDNLEKHIRSLQVLKQPTQQWDALIVPIIIAKLDEKTMREWETKINAENTSRENVPTYSELISFLNHRQTTLEAIANKKLPLETTKPRKFFAHVSNTIQKCAHCDKDTHQIFNCEKFKALSHDEKLKKVRDSKLCINCLRKGHYISECKAGPCKNCGKKHNTLLHNEKEKTSESKQTAVVSTVSCPSTSGSLVLLSTALVEIKDNYGKYHKARALLDSGSQSCFMTEEIRKMLDLPKVPINYAIAGIGRSKQDIAYHAYAEVRSINSKSYKFKTDFLVLPIITENIPIYSFNSNSIKIPDGLRLADPQYNCSRSIDMLIGSEIFWQLLKSNQIKLDNGPTLQDTHLGWIIGGSMHSANKPKKAISCASVKLLEQQLQRFWQMDEFENIPILTEEEKFCEQHFTDTCQRNEDGRFVVAIPLKPTYEKLGESFSTAKRRLELLDRKLEKDPKLKQEYMTFLREYENLNHMSKVNITDDEFAVYLPHHGVLKESSTTTRLRVVFDASCKTSSGLSLNDVQCVGPIIQSDLFTILNNFRLSPYIATGDVEKMYRQILIRESDRRYQRILWHSSDTKELVAYQLNTVTYGTASASYLATRCLQQLANENEQDHPIEANIIKNSCYMDDLIIGANSIEELKQRKQNITQILALGKFNLRKWRSNAKVFLEENASENDTHVVKTLGIVWQTEQDVLRYETKMAVKDKVTKRSILACTAQLFDPYGLLAPAIIVPKLIIQELWHDGLRWDEPIKSSQAERWEEFKRDIVHVNEIEIPRFILAEATSRIELHGFADASEKAYGACVYIRSFNKNGEITVNLLSAKSRVAPLKKVTLPRLELCAATLLAQLMEKLRKTLNLVINDEYYWSDSTISLCWIRSEPARWVTFVANRVAEIHRSTDSSKWRHVQSKENPADMISRGILVSQLKNSELWWNGPHWLNNNIELEHGDDDFIPNDNIPEQRKIVLSNKTDIKIFDRFSSLNSLLNVMSYCFRFMNTSAREKYKGKVTCVEREDTLFKCIKSVQASHYSEEIKQLYAEKQIKSKSHLLPLHPFIDGRGLLRVGGRLQKSNLEFDKMHQIILPPDNHLTKLIATEEHKKQLHCGPQALLNHLRQKYWPIKGNQLVKGIYRKCIKCFKVNPTQSKLFMGELPKARITPTPPFYNCGIDYAGPIMSKERNTRKPKLYKSYIAVFVCFSTKALHLELVSDLTTNAFLQALRRFIARRGKPEAIWSDNGTNFVGAKNELETIIESQDVHRDLANQEIQWNFIPPRAPHFGGLWEASVRSIKTNLKRVIGNTILTFEELYTLLVEIESCLNSRPLSPLSDNPEDLTPLTPGHFIIGRPITSVVERGLIEAPNKLKHYQQIQAMKQHFWQRWQREYLNQLQTRYKWHQEPTQPKMGDLVVIIEDNTPPLLWKMGRIESLHSGTDGITRVVSVKTSTGTIKRPTKKICILPN